jgi:hypothetical protein
MNSLGLTNEQWAPISICRDHASNVKGWRDGQMALRWCADGMVEASGQFRRVNGHLHLAVLRTALERHVAAETVGPDCNTQDVSQPDAHRAATEVPRNSGHPPSLVTGLVWSRFDSTSYDTAIAVDGPR